MIMAILKPDKTTNLGGVTVNEYLLTKHNPNKIDMPSVSMEGRIIGVTIHNTDWISVASRTTPAEQYTRATVNGNMRDTRVHYYVDNVCAWQNLPLTLSGWHAADGSGNGNRRTIAIECIMSSAYNDKDKKSEDNCAKLAAALLKKYKLGINALYTHNHWYSGKYCPAYILPHWDKFKAKVQSYMNSGSSASATPSAKQIYRVRKSWSDAKSQIGAYSSLENAKKACKTGYTVYNKDGKAVYSKSVTSTIKVGDTVKVKSRAKDYNGNSLADFVYKTKYKVIEISGNRVVVGINGNITAAVHKNNLVKI